MMRARYTRITVQSSSIVPLLPIALSIAAIQVLPVLTAMLFCRAYQCHYLRLYLLQVFVAKFTVLVLHVQVEPASRSPLAASRQASRSNSSSRSHEGFVSVSSASRSSGSQHGTNSLPATAEAASDSLAVQPPASPTHVKDGASAQEASGTQPSQTSTLDTSRDQPVAVDPFEQSLHALHAEQQDSQSQTPDTESQKPASQQGGPESQGTAGAQEGSQPPTAVTEPQRSGSALQVPVQDPKASGSSGAGSSAASARAASTEAAVNASPVGSASTDAWEMVQDANNIYNWKAGSLFGRSLSSNRRQGSECSEEGESYSQCEHSCRQYRSSRHIRCFGVLAQQHGW